MDASPSTKAERGRGPGHALAVARARSRALWTSLWPFALFQDPSRGDVYARAAARQHNLRMRAKLPQYLRRWLVICCLASTAIYAFDAMAADVSRRLDVFVLMAAGSGIVCAYAVCALLVIGYAYLNLRRLEER
jgi:hypothetical protein